MQNMSIGSKERFTWSVLLDYQIKLDKYRDTCQYSVARYKWR